MFTNLHLNSALSSLVSQTVTAVSAHYSSGQHSACFHSYSTEGAKSSNGF